MIFTVCLPPLGPPALDPNLAVFPIHIPPFQTEALFPTDSSGCIEQDQGLLHLSFRRIEVVQHLDRLFRGHNSRLVLRDDGAANTTRILFLWNERGLAFPPQESIRIAWHARTPAK